MTAETDVGFAADVPEAATRLVAEVRARCAALGVSPRQFAEILLPEALLAMMVSGMSQEEAVAAFEDFASREVPAWYLQVKRTAGFCDCAREAHAGHAADCASLLVPPR